jgi:hypothetical protein
MADMSKKYAICSKCVMDTTDARITFDSHGVCDQCRTFESEIMLKWDHYGSGDAKLLALGKAIKKKS